MPQAIFQFGGFRLDREEFTLKRGDRSLRLERKPLELLILLVERSGQLVTRDEIAQHLWGSGVFVDVEHGINTAIRKIRQILDDDSEEPHFVQTVTGKGYRFLAPVAVEPDVDRVGALLSSALQSAPVAVEAPKPARRLKFILWSLGAVSTLLLAIAAASIYRTRLRPPEVRYTQLTDFTDSAVEPALSPDDKTLAFIRGPAAFFSADPLYVKALPNGEARPITKDEHPKYGLQFSPDGSEVAYTVLEPPQFNTYEVSVFGGDPHLLLRNAAGLSWLDPRLLLFSRIKSGIHLGVVTGTAKDGDIRDIYLPAHQRGMAHYSHASPDHRWILVVEMDENGWWAPCRLVALTGSHQSRRVGPNGSCTAAAWSPDGHWMYFTATVNEQSHVWRQRFPDGAPQQVTFGAAEEEGLAVEKTGSFITSVGTRESAIWLHDESGDRPLSSEGDVVTNTPPCFRENDSVLYFLLRRKTGEAAAELWRFRIKSGESEAVFPDLALLNYDVSPDGKQVIYTTQASDNSTDLWIAPADRSSPAKRLGIRGANWPYFGLPGRILFQLAEGNANYLEQARTDGSDRAKVSPYPISEISGVSPGRRWVMVLIPQFPVGGGPAPAAIPLDGGAPLQICAHFCVPTWSSNGTYLFVPVESPSEKGPGRSLAIPVGPNETIPRLPAGGIPPLSDASVVPGAQSVPRADLIAGKDPAHYAFVNTTVHRNLFSVSLY
jgi:DNA-binding winged helix-turn-helix (wHTH) protein